MNFLHDIESYVPFGEYDAVAKQFILDSYHKYNGDIFTRDNVDVHAATSAWVVNPERTKVLMAYHNIYKCFAWFGGHNDGEQDCMKVAIEELVQESGINNYKILSPEIFFLFKDNVPEHIKNGKQVKEHFHAGPVYLFEVSEDETFRVKHDENSRIEWIPIADVEHVAAASEIKKYTTLIQKPLKS